MQASKQQERIHTLDILRGFALFGIIFVNIPTLLQFPFPESTLDHTYYYFLQIFVEGKFFSIFSFLFGVGFYIFISRALMRGENGFLLLAKRLGILLIFGLIHMLFHPGEALTIYAIFGLLLLLIQAHQLPRLINLVVGIIGFLGLTVLTMKVLIPLPLILLGIAAGQYGIFQHIQQHYKRWVYFTMSAGMISAAFVIYQLTHLPSAQYFTLLNQHTPAEITSYLQFYNLTTWSAPFLSSFYVGLIVCLCNTRIASLFSPLQYFGRMAFTNYVAQTACMLLFGSLVLRMFTVTYIQLGLVALAINVLLIVLSVMILNKFNYGPLEKLWRMGTYFSRQKKAP